MFLWYPEYRRLIVDGFLEIILKLQVFEHFNPDAIAGTATAGIPYAILLADAMGLPMAYIRDKPKDHGLRNQIEGIDANKDLGKSRVLVIEDLISTGGSSAKAVQAVRNARGIVPYCLSIFNYGLPKAVDMFKGIVPFGKEEGEQLKEPCMVISLLHYEQLLSVAIDHGFIDKNNEEMLREWMSDQENWDHKHNLQKTEK
ncbi:MAG: phosphoribosyltransferase family protein [Patescibacteria group bacterium]